MKTLPPEQLYYLHDLLTYIMIGLCLIISYAGFKIKAPRLKIQISLVIIIFCVTQEILDYLNRIFFDELYIFSLGTDLPLQFCVIGFYFSIFGIIMAIADKSFNPKLEQFVFDCSYVLGFGGALQALLNVDLSGVNNMIGIFTLNWTHSLIILNVLWLIFAYKKRFNGKSIINAFVFINLIIIPVGLVNYLLGANYMFICNPPNVDSSFFMGEWPYYLFYLEGIYFIYILILYLPFKIAEKFQAIKL